MKIYSWNTLRTNSTENALALIRSLEFDVMCLQEVPPPLLAELKKLPFSLAADVESTYTLRGVAKEDYSVVLSRYPIATSGSLRFPASPFPLRMRLFALLVRPPGWKHFGGRHSMYADIETPQGALRVFSIHLSLSHPSARLHEFDMLADNMRSDAPNVLAGDFNLLDSPHITPLNWIYGGTVRDALLYKRERSAFEERFASLHLQNVLLGTRTQLQAFCQLDHILIPDDWRVTQAQVIAQRHGSDHHPIFVEASRS